MPNEVVIKVDKATVFDSKLEADVKKTAKKAAESEAKGRLEGKYFIKLTPTLKFDEKARMVVSTCGWKVYEGSESMLFERLKQTKFSTGSATANPAKITQQNLDDAVGGAAATEVAAIMKSLKAMEEMDKKKR